jgi:hypothetical protein
MTIAAMAHPLTPEDGDAGAPVVVVVGRDALVEVAVVVVVVVGEPVAAKATTRNEDGARNNPAPTAGVAKWLLSTPTAARVTTLPVVGLRPYRVPFWLIVHTRPAAMRGGPPPTAARPSTRRPAGAAVAWTAMGPAKQGR